MDDIHGLLMKYYWWKFKRNSFFQFLRRRVLKFLGYEVPYSEVQVFWLNPADDYRAWFIVIQEPELEDLFGFKKKKINAVGIATEPQAARVGEAFLFNQDGSIPPRWAADKRKGSVK